MSRFPRSRARWAGILGAALLLPLTTGCAETHLDCALGVSFQGGTYMPWQEKGEIPTGKRVGTAKAPATFADPQADTCDLTTPLTALAVKGVDPSIAFFAPDSPGGLYVSEEVDSVTEMPDALQRLVRRRG
jgi:hypothetical protein